MLRPSVGFAVVPMLSLMTNITIATKRMSSKISSTPTTNQLRTAWRSSFTTTGLRSQRGRMMGERGPVMGGCG